ncbi:MAG: PRC-barrel domain-containing protein [Hyphomicrobium aestuarii]|nr:PRC-barrel domain-containing protein [Hyphomicrobium aestuarii]
MKSLILATIVAIAATTPSFAQSTAPVTPAPMATVGDAGIFYGKPYEYRVAKMLGTQVTNGANETIGDINDVVVDKDGKVAAVIIGVGGFLGMGERNVAVTFSALQLSRDTGGAVVVKVNTTKDALKTAPEWKWQMSGN